METKTNVEVVKVFPANEANEANDYWTNRSFEYYKHKRPWTDFMVNEILQLFPYTVFEFGCNAGKNLLAIKKIKPDLFCSGIDINAKAIEFGRTEFKLPLSVGDQRTLDIIPDSAFDISYTVSVLDHVPKPDNILKNLGRISRKAVLLLEPFTGEEGKVIRNTNRLQLPFHIRGTIQNLLQIFFLTAS